MRAHVRFITPQGLARELGHGDLIGRLPWAALSIDDPRVSEAHAMVSLRRGELVLLGLVVAAGALLVGCRSTEPPAEPAPAPVPTTVLDARPPPDARPARFEIVFTADDRAELRVEGRVEGTYADGPALGAAVSRVRAEHPELGPRLSIKLPQVFGKHVRRDFMDALEAVGYMGLFGNPL